MKIHREKAVKTQDWTDAAVSQEAPRTANQETEKAEGILSSVRGSTALLTPHFELLASRL